ncbi:hypothetical protein AAE478_003425 [Parahypoxylon ruwenzoriense]
MSIDIRDLSASGVDRLTKLLSRRPEYGIAIPSRRWLTRQEQKLGSLPSELSMTSNPLKRLVIKIADKIDPNMIDPRAVLCKTHSVLNPWLIRRLFLAVAYEVTVYSDALRSWPGRKDDPALSAFIGRVDAIAALWTEPELYRECYGTPPFESHMIFVRSGCEACILSAIGANAGVLADLRTVIIDRIERRPPRRDGRQAKAPRLARFVETWIDHLKQERAGKCRAISDDVLTELRALRPQLKQWRNRRRKDSRRTYTELRRKGSKSRLSNVPSDARRKRRTRNGIPVAMVDLEGAEEQRKAAMENNDQGAKSIYRPDSMCGFSQFGTKTTPAYDPAAELAELDMAANNNSNDDDDWDPYDDFEETDGKEGVEQDLEEEERSRRKVTDWYATRLESRVDLTLDDTKSVLSMVHPAFRSTDDNFSHLSAVPSPLRIKKDRAPPLGGSSGQSDVWTNATVYTVDPTDDAPPVPRVPSIYREAPTGDAARTPRPRSLGRGLSTTQANPTVRSSRQSYAASSVYSEQPTPTEAVPARPRSVQVPSRPPPVTAARKPTPKYLFNDTSDAGSNLSMHQRQYLRKHQGMKTFPREENPFTRGNAGGSSGRSTPTSSRQPAPRSRFSSGSVPSMTSHGITVTGSEPLTPTSTTRAFRNEDDGTGGLGPDDSLSNFVWQQAAPSVQERIEQVTPWASFAKLPPR